MVILQYGSRSSIQPVLSDCKHTNIHTWWLNKTPNMVVRSEGISSFWFCGWSVWFYYLYYTVQLWLFLLWLSWSSLRAKCFICFLTLPSVLAIQVKETWETVQLVYRTCKLIPSFLFPQWPPPLPHSPLPPFWTVMLFSSWRSSTFTSN